MDNDSNSPAAPALVEACRFCGCTSFTEESSFLVTTWQCKCCGRGDSDYASVVLDKHGKEVPPLIRRMTEEDRLALVRRHSKPELTDAPAKTQTSKETQNG